MDRAKLIEMLDDVAPALAANDIVPIMSHFWFTGKNLMAYNNNEGICISLPLQTDFTGALPQTLLALLKSSAAKSVELLADGDAMIVKAASSKIKLAMLPAEDFNFKPPAMPKDVKLPCDPGRFIAAIEACLFSVGSDTSKADHMGVTVINDTSAKELLFFATDHETMCHTTLKYKADAKGQTDLAFDRIILRKAFCQQLVRLCKGVTDELALYLCEDYAQVVFEGTRIFGANVEPDNNPMDFEKAFNALAPEASLKKSVAIPDKFEKILDRACIITDASIEKSRTEIKISDGKAYFKSKSERGELADVSQLPDHPNVTVYVDPRRMKDGYGRFDKIIFTKLAATMTRGAYHYLVAASEA